MHEWTSESMKEAFNIATHQVRVVAIVSPTCPECLEGFGFVRELFEELRGHRVAGFVVWIPMLARDTAAAAQTQSESLQDARVVQGWDAHRQIGNLFKTILRLHKTAWDVYLLYPPGVTWADRQPPVPAFWMHQLGSDPGADRSRFLNPARFTQEVQATVGTNA